MGLLFVSRVHEIFAYDLPIDTSRYAFGFHRKFIIDVRCQQSVLLSNLALASISVISLLFNLVFAQLHSISILVRFHYYCLQFVFGFRGLSHKYVLDDWDQ